LISLLFAYLSLLFSPVVFCYKFYVCRLLYLSGDLLNIMFSKKNYKAIFSFQLLIYFLQVLAVESLYVLNTFIHNFIHIIIMCIYIFFGLLVYLFIRQSQNFNLKPNTKVLTFRASKLHRNMHLDNLFPPDPLTSHRANV
jgi:hypothetical protein